MNSQPDDADREDRPTKPSRTSAFSRRTGPSCSAGTIANPSVFSGIKTSMSMRYTNLKIRLIRNEKQLLYLLIGGIYVFIIQNFWVNFNELHDNLTNHRAYEPIGQIRLSILRVMFFYFMIYLVAILFVYIRLGRKSKLSPGAIIARDVVVIVGLFDLLVQFINAMSRIYCNIGLNLPAGRDSLSLSDCAYFSIVTFTMLGYGDITPNDASRFLAMVQALLGVMFMPIVVSLLVNLLIGLRRV